MLLLIRDYIRDDGSSLRVEHLQFRLLVPKVIQDNAFYRLGRQRDRTPAEQPRHEYEREPPKPAKVITPAASDSSSCQFLAK